MADRPESGALLTDSAAGAGEEASSAPEVTIEFNGWQQYVRDRVVAGDSLGDAWFGVWLQSVSSHDDHNFKFLAYMAQNFAILFFTMPLHVTAMKVYNFQWSRRGQICKLMGVLYQLVVGCAGVFAFLVVDYLLVNLPRSPTMSPYFTCRPFTVFLVKRVGYSFIASALNRHPSASFRVTFLISMHLTLGVTGVSAACKAKTWQGLLMFVAVDTVVKLLGFYCFTLAGTEHLKNYRILRYAHTIFSKGRPDPWPGMVKGQYRALEMLIQTISMNSLLLGLIFTYFAVAYWIQDVEEFRPALQFWFPMRGYTVLVLLLLLVRELMYEQVAYYLADYKTGVDYKPVLRAWLRKDSMIGWQGVLMTGLFTAFIPSLLTVTVPGLSTMIALAKA